MKHIKQIGALLPLIVLMYLVLPSCKKNTDVKTTGRDTVPVPPPAAFDINSINDTYADVSAFTFYSKWDSYNVHDPSIKKFGDYYYCYSTDVGYGTAVPAGLQVRKSKDLVQWQFVGWVFSALPAKGAQYISAAGGTPNNALWAPYMLKINNEYRLYYSLSSNKNRLSVIGLATAASPEGPWTEQGIVVASTEDKNNIVQTNAIDPTVLVTTSGDHYLYYGSAWNGIYMLKLNAATGMAASSGDIGKQIANRGFTNGVYNGNIEGAEIIFNKDLNKYFLFISYDWLQTKYNIRVCRSDNPEGPFKDYKGDDATVKEDHGPMILAPYQFSGHGGRVPGIAVCSTTAVIIILWHTREGRQ